MPRLLAKDTVRSAGAAAPSTSPEAPSRPLGTSTAQIGTLRAFMSDKAAFRMHVCPLTGHSSDAEHAP